MILDNMIWIGLIKMVKFEQKLERVIWKFGIKGQRE